jgi:Flp pilus assembly protein TadG
MTEFSLVIPILMVLILGLIEMGRLIYTYSAVTTASREATRYGFSLGDNGFGVARYQDCDGIREAARAPTSIAGIEDAGIDISFDTGPGTAVISNCPPVSVETGTRIVVTVSASFEPIMPLIQLPDIDISSTSKRTILAGVDAIE